MSRGLTVIRSIHIDASISEVWNALLDPAIIKKYLFGTEATVDPNIGGKITYEGEWEGKKYKDEGTILKFEPEKTLEVTHSSSISEHPEDYHIVTYTLKPNNGGTEITISQDNAKNEEQREHFGKNWDMVLAAMKTVLENKE